MKSHSVYTRDRSRRQVWVKLKLLFVIGFSPSKPIENFFQHRTEHWRAVIGCCAAVDVVRSTEGSADRDLPGWFLGNVWRHRPLHSNAYIRFCSYLNCEQFAYATWKCPSFEDSSLLWRYAVSIGKQLPTFRIIVVPASTGSSNHFSRLIVNKDKRSAILRNVGRCVPIDTA